MVNPGREGAAAELLAAGTLSQRAIARQAKVSRGTVNAMANGRRPRDLSRRAAAAKPNGQTIVTVPMEARCLGCGVMVTFLPCHRCRIRKLLHAARRRPATLPEPDEPLTCALLEEDQARYELLRQRKVDELLDGMLLAEERAELDEIEPTVEELCEIEMQNDECRVQNAE